MQGREERRPNTLSTPLSLSLDCLSLLFFPADCTWLPLFMLFILSRGLVIQNRQLRWATPFGWAEDHITCRVWFRNLWPPSPLSLAFSLTFHGCRYQLLRLWHQKTWTGCVDSVWLGQVSDSIRGCDGCRGAWEEPQIFSWAQDKKKNVKFSNEVYNTKIQKLLGGWLVWGGGSSFFFFSKMQMHRGCHSEQPSNLILKSR